MKREVFQRALLATARVACCASFLAACQKPDDKVREPINTRSSVAPRTLAECAASSAEPTKTPEQERQERKACCVKITKDAAPQTEASEVRGLFANWSDEQECCNVLELRGCFAWGPPCPPAMEA
jgi:hypothetical protein